MRKMMYNQAQMHLQGESIGFTNTSVLHMVINF